MPVIYRITKDCWNCTHQKEKGKHPCDECETQGVGRAPLKWEDSGELFPLKEVEILTPKGCLAVIGETV